MIENAPLTADLVPGIELGGPLSSRKFNGLTDHPRRPTMIICRVRTLGLTNRDLRRWAGIDNRQMLELFRHDV